MLNETFSLIFKHRAYTQRERVWRCWKKRTPVDRCFMCNKDASSSLLGFYGCVKAWKTIALLLVFQIVLHIYCIKSIETKTQCLKIIEKVSFNIASEASGHKVIKICQKWSILTSFRKPEACGHTELPDRSVLIGQKLVKNAKIKNFKCDI